MRTQITMKLSKAARSKGGDRYDGTLPSGETLNIYLPQELSRDNGDGPAASIKLAIETN